MVVLDSEIGTAITINDLLWKRAPMGMDHSSYTNFKIYMGYTTRDILEPDFDSNYVPGSKTLVFSRSTYTLSGLASGAWFTTALDTPFFYNGSGNLLIDIEWTSSPDGLSVYVFNWNTDVGRSMFSSPAGSTGDPENFVPHMILGGTNDLESKTFARIKIMFAK
ncbi:MAG TPA: hypothetical protein PLX54_04875 [Candidatus Fermentibacter daniensis]|nr:hypothetical protein [Candidatus Fermentibacter daniensis]HOR08095.1 hypothetical protein [Candidatus Fermentibacter daniensis]HPK51687.1 hypothetical protein [Candidatus Fermentibacter daniensis]